ncbi:unnamed protein product [Owenia fusiformis]|uniref:Uncharacterized protein n=1 Tax=Owenia fusiformis TaxID=6347 RepID=A0A8S4NXP2_OWEFU|nr:unnamed protein product [Owenia fusiformis]
MDDCDTMIVFTLGDISGKMFGRVSIEYPVARISIDHGRIDLKITKISQLITCCTSIQVTNPYNEYDTIDRSIQGINPDNEHDTVDRSASSSAGISIAGFPCDQRKRHGVKCKAIFPSQSLLDRHLEMFHTFDVCNVGDCRVKIIKGNPIKMQRHRTTCKVRMVANNQLFQPEVSLTRLQTFDSKDLRSVCPKDIFDNTESDNKTIVYDPLANISFDEVNNIPSTKKSESIPKETHITKQCGKSEEPPKSANKEVSLNTFIDTFESIVGQDKPIAFSVSARDSLKTDLKERQTNTNKVSKKSTHHDTFKSKHKTVKSKAAPKTTAVAKKSAPSLSQDVASVTSKRSQKTATKRPVPAPAHQPVKYIKMDIGLDLTTKSTNKEPSPTQKQTDTFTKQCHCRDILQEIVIPCPHQDNVYKLTVLKL